MKSGVALRLPPHSTCRVTDTFNRTRPFMSRLTCPPLLWDIGIIPASQTTIYESSRAVIICFGLARSLGCHLHGAKRLFSEHRRFQSRNSSPVRKGSIRQWVESCDSDEQCGRGVLY